MGGRRRHSATFRSTILQSVGSWTLVKTAAEAYFCREVRMGGLWNMYHASSLPASIDKKRVATKLKSVLPRKGTDYADVRARLIIFSLWCPKTRSAVICTMAVAVAILCEINCLPLRISDKTSVTKRFVPQQLIFLCVHEQYECLLGSLSFLPLC